MRRWACLLGTLLIATSAVANGTGTGAEQALRQRIGEEIGEARCSAVADCRVLAVGSRPCGGPASWLAWSVTSSDGARLAAWAGELAALQRRRDEAEGRMSTCQVLPEPGAACRAGRCVLLPGAGAAAR